MLKNVRKWQKCQKMAKMSTNASKMSQNKNQKRNIDNFKKVFSGPKIEKILLVQFSRARQDESIALREFQNFKNFLVYTVIFLKTAVRFPNFF